ncbi:tetratricopeptide repeat protein [Silvanigrella aquatica]|uniref:Outer membrane lipoprotein BamD-like domain-containing protein n=1 Tax=Silvanigrella aquatica TaxID=1915309 RepID=A0A1L4D1U0_9BACT|nr:outer membrane protein assembly factor BamD [Silvanigrella aquatica]APJ04175.1 hypothetical protein AXG55_09770 [Silvanigrella aquatica]
MIKSFQIIGVFIFTLFISSCVSNPNDFPKSNESQGNSATPPSSGSNVGAHQTEQAKNFDPKEIIDLHEQSKQETLEKIDQIESSSKEREKHIMILENEIKKMSYQVNDLSQDNIVSKKVISYLKNDMNSLNEQLLSQRKEIEILKRGLRSGIFEDQASFEKQPPGIAGVTMLPDMMESRDIYTDKKMDSGGIPLQSATMMSNNEPMGPPQLLSEAEKKLTQGQFNEALTILNSIKKNFPNFEDNGKSLLLASEAWLRLGEYNNVFNELRTYYVKFPNTPELAHAKLMEGQTYEKLNSKSKAAQVYQEVISLSPQGTDAQNAREGLLRMRDAK